MKNILSVALVTAMAGSASAQELTVDNCGETLVFETPPQRLVVHDMNMTDMAFALGLQDKIVGLTGITGGTRPARISTRCAAIFPSSRQNIRRLRTLSRLRLICSLQAGITACSRAAT